MPISLLRRVHPRHQWCSLPCESPCPCDEVKNICSYTRYPAKATVAIPKPGNNPLNLFALEKGPVYRHASLSIHQSKHPQSREFDVSPSSSFSNILPRPWVVVWLSRCRCELLRVEAGKIRPRSHDFPIALAEEDVQAPSEPMRCGVKSETCV